MKHGDRVVLHVCCAPCLAGPLKQLRDEGLEVTGFFYNPNIHPLLEFRRRLKALKVFCESDPLPVLFCEDYGLEDFLREVYSAARSSPARCESCYRMRLSQTARKAREMGVKGFTTTLLASRQQDHDLVRRAGEEVGGREGIELLYRDFRPTAPLSDEVARRRQIYRQSYCGCIFSEYERYRSTTKYLYGAGAGANHEN